MNKAILFLGFLTLAACQKSVYIASRTTSVRFHDILEQEIAKVLDIPEYHRGMKPGSSFIITVCPGIPINSLELSFALCDTVFLSPKQYDRAYLFARLVNVGIPYTQFNSSTPAFLTNGSFVEMALREKVIENASLLKLYHLSNPHYSDEFYFTTVNPRPQAAEWTNISVQRFNTASTIIGKRSVKYQQLSYKFSADLKLLNIYRPWLNLAGNATDTLPLEKNTFAIITQLVIGQRMSIDDFQGNVLRVSAKGKVIDTLHATSSMKTDSAVIIGFVCLII